MSPRNRLIIILTFIVGVVLVLALIFGRAPSTRKATEDRKTTPEKIVLTEFADRDSRVVFTIDGQINSEQEHRAIRISVGRNSKTIDVIQGYGNNVIKTQTFANTPEGYDVFIHAIDRLGFGSVRKTKQTDSRGVCPLSQRYFYQLIDNNDTKLDLWSASCQNIGTTRANASVVRTLFQRQVPGFSQFTSDVQL